MREREREREITLFRVKIYVGHIKPYNLIIDTMKMDNRLRP